MIADRRVAVSLTSLGAWLLWLIVAGCMVAAFLVHNDAHEHAQVHAVLIGAIGLSFSAAAATLHIRALLCTFSRNLRESFELGREVEREQQQQLRSVR